MPIRFITGKPGAGKGLVLMQQLAEELRQTKRCIVTNFAIELMPWVTADGRPQLGLLAYLRHTYKETFNAENRIFKLTDDQAAMFFLYRPVPAGDGKFELKKAEANVITSKDGSEKVMDFDCSLMVESGGVCYAIDEGWKFWGSRNWQRTGEGVMFYNSQHRKPGDDCWIATQHTKQIDPSILRVSQEFWHVRNRGMLRVGIFRQPDDFSVAVYEDPPTGSLQDPMNRFKFKLDIKGLAQCYDTTGGVGLTGRMVGDYGKKKQGKPFKYLIGACALVPVVSWFAIKAVTKTANAAMVPRSSVSNNAPSSSRKLVDEFFPGNRGEHAHVKLKDTEPDEVVMTGYCRINGQWRVFLSDGREVVSGEELTYLEKSYCVVGTNRYRLASISQRLSRITNSVHGSMKEVLSPAPFQEVPEMSSPVRVRLSKSYVWDAERKKVRE